jgi:hypothetical protein
LNCCDPHSGHASLILILILMVIYSLPPVLG